MTTVRFCSSCGAARIEGARFCGSCGADFEALGRPPVPAGPDARTAPSPVAQAETPAPPPAPRSAEAATTPVAGRAARAGSRPTRDEGPARRRRPLVLVGLVVFLAIAAGVGVGAVLLLRPSSAPGGVAGSPFASPIALTSPSASQVLEGLADPSTPAYQAGSGFTPDAVRLMTVTVFELSVSRYHDAVGAYPTSLDALFPTYAPPGPDGAPMAGPPSAAEGYTYSTTGSAYTFSVVLASGQSYAVTGP